MTSASPGGQRSASIAMSTWWSSSHALTASIWSWRRPCSSSSLFIFSVGHVLAELHRDCPRSAASSARVSATPSSTFSLTVFVGSSCGSCAQVADLEARRRPRLAEEVLVDARHDAQQRALAGAVVAEHADLRARIERQPDAFQDLALRRHELAQILHHVRVLGGHGRRLYPTLLAHGLPRRGRW